LTDRVAPNESVQVVVIFLKQSGKLFTVSWRFVSDLIRRRRLMTGFAKLTLAVGAICLIAALMAFTRTSEPATHIRCGENLTRNTLLDTDLIDCARDGLIIRTDGITVDLNGHTITGSFSDDSVGIRNEGHDHVTITNGRVSEFERGLYLTSGADHNRIHNLTVTDNSGDGIGLINANDNRLENNQTLSNGSGFFLTTCSGNRIEGNTVNENTINGIFLDDCQTNRIENNEVNGTGVLGGLGAIALLNSEGNHVRLNTVSNSRDPGIALIESNGNRVIGNTVAESAADGMLVEAGSSGNVIAQNVANRNRDDGIDVNDPATTITQNIANQNGSYGIEAVAGVIDGGGNRARGNGNPDQCLNIVCSD
jgi:parallel beta-helix repeat protein